MYVQLGPNNGGIVVNLGIDGVGCQAAMKVIAEKNSTLNLRLRGSGLNADLVGELVWLGPTQKEVGIRFKSLSSNVRQDIADWIAREAPVGETATPVDRSRPMPAMPGMSARNNFVPYHLGVASALSQAMPAKLPSSAVADAIESHPPASSDSASGISDTTSPTEIVPPIADSNIPADESDDHAQGPNADSSAPPEQPQVEEPLYNHLIFDPPPVKKPGQSEAGNPSPIVISEKLKQPVREDPPKASLEPPGDSKLSKAEKNESTPQAQASPSPDNSHVETAAERWIPPALLDAWSKGNSQHKFLLVSAPAACLLTTALILILAVTYIRTSLDRSTGSGSLQQSSARRADSSAGAGSPDAGELDAPADLQAADQPESDQPPPTPLERFAMTFLGYKPDKPDPDAQTRIQIQIDKDHVGVPVWASKSSGYYYCTDSTYYKTVQPGAVMTQRDALQNGYQPKLRRFCN